VIEKSFLRTGMRSNGNMPVTVEHARTCVADLFQWAEGHQVAFRDCAAKIARSSGGDFKSTAMGRLPGKLALHPRQNDHGEANPTDDDH
jgi:hypothetical protein